MIAPREPDTIILSLGLEMTSDAAVRPLTAGYWVSASRHQRGTVPVTERGMLARLPPGLEMRLSFNLVNVYMNLKLVTVY